MSLGSFIEELPQEKRFNGWFRGNTISMHAPTLARAVQTKQSHLTKRSINDLHQIGISIQSAETQQTLYAEHCVWNVIVRPKRLPGTIFFEQPFNAYPGTGACFPTYQLPSY